MKRALRIAGIALQGLAPVSATVDIGLVLAGARIYRWEVLVMLGLFLMFWGLVMSERKAARIWRKLYKSRPDVEIAIYINDQLIVGPMTGEHMAYIARYGGFPHDQVDLMEGCLRGDSRIGDVRFVIKYLPPDRPPSFRPPR